jgi:GTPase
MAARARIEELMGRQIVLKLWVRVTPDWRESKGLLAELGYGKERSEGPKEASQEYVLLATRDDDESALDEESEE